MALGQRHECPKLIAKTMTKDHWDGDITHQAINELCWQSTAFTATAVSTAMAEWLDVAGRAVEQGIPQLSDREVQLYRLLYIGVPETCGYPLAALFERLDLLEPWLGALATDPNGTPNWEVLYTLLRTYAWIAEVRREADRELKRRRRRKGAPLSKFGLSTAKSPPIDSR
jgi:hypothetical protein